MITNSYSDTNRPLHDRLDVKFALKAARLGVWELDPITRLISWDERCRELFGLASDNQLPYEQAIQYIHPDDVERVDQAVRQALSPQSGGDYDVVYRTVGADDGLLRWVRFTGQSYFNEAGEVIRFAGVARDVTDHKKAEEALKLSEARFRSLIDEAPIATSLYVGPQFVIELANDAKIAYWGKGRSVIGKPLAVALPELKGQPFLKILENVFTTGQTYETKADSVDLVVNGTPGTYYFDFTYKPLRDASGAIFGIMNMAVDVTGQVLARKALEDSEKLYRSLSAALDEQVQQRTQQLQASVQDLQRSNDNLQQFAYVASHDLQEPLRKIQSFSDMLKNQYREQLGTSGNDFLNRMQTSASRMSILIKDLLTYSRISTQQDSRSSVILSRVIEQVLNDLDLTVQETNALIQVDSLPTIQGDKSQLGQLFQNLLNNAIKFRQPDQPPHIAITCQTVAYADVPPSVRPARPAAAYHRINVTDNGIGFNEKYADRIFQVFQRLHGKSQYAGTGIGLAICEKVVANHGGAITATSQPGKGATFSVYLPT
ncbi:MAG: PAS domain-containing protein [Rudanella sp.]|nr:PAS domain-containing protein [Rudanella sp.]